MILSAEEIESLLAGCISVAQDQGMNVRRTRYVTRSQGECCAIGSLEHVLALGIAEGFGVVNALGGGDFRNERDIGTAVSDGFEDITGSGYDDLPRRYYDIGVNLHAAFVEVK